MRSAWVGFAFVFAIDSFAGVGESVVKIVAHDRVAGQSTSASGFVFRHEGRIFVVTSEHAVLNTPVAGGVSAVRFQDRIELIPGNPAPPEGGWPAAKVFRSIRSLDRGPIEITENGAWGEFEGITREGASVNPIAYAVSHPLVPNGLAAKFLISDWGRGITLLEISRPEAAKAIPMHEWSELKTRMRSGTTGEIALSGYPAASQRLRTNGGKASAEPFVAPIIAQVPAMVAVSESFAEFGMSGGVAWDRDGNYVGLISHLTSEENPARRVLLIPGEFVRKWLVQWLETKDLELQLYKDVSQESSDTWEAIYSRGVIYSLNCYSKTCSMGFDLNERVNPTVSYLDHENRVLTAAKKRLEFYRPLATSGKVYVASVDVRGFRPPLTHLHQFGRNGSEIRRIRNSVEFFHFLRDPELLPVVDFGWNMTWETEKRIERAIESFGNVHRFFSQEIQSAAENPRGTRRERERRAADALETYPLIEALYSAKRELQDLDRTETGTISGYSAALLPQDFEVFWSDPFAQKSWAAIDRLFPGRRNEFESQLRNLRHDLADVVVDPTENYDW